LSVERPGEGAPEEPGFDAEEILAEVIDDLLPKRLDWKRLVRTYPVPSLLVAAAGGYLLGRRHGAAVLASLSGLAVSQVSRHLDLSPDSDAS
jgi:hypothetical protein